MQTEPEQGGRATRRLGPKVLGCWTEAQAANREQGFMLMVLPEEELQYV